MEVPGILPLLKSGRIKPIVACVRNDGDLDGTRERGWPSLTSG